MKHDTVLWIVGEPGLGKTTLARVLMGEVRSLVLNPKWTIGEHATAAGHYIGEAFDGADTISYSGGMKALETYTQIVKDAWEGLTILDGDRLSNARAVNFVRQMAKSPRPRPLRLRCVLLTAPPRVGTIRRLMRAKKTGRLPQNATWAKGRVTKSLNFLKSFQFEERLLLDLGEWREDQGPRTLAGRVREWLA